MLIRIFKYLRQNKRLYIISLVFFVIFIAAFMLYKLPVKAVLYPAFLCFLIGVIASVIDFNKTNIKHNSLAEIKNITDTLDNDFLSTESIIESDLTEIIRLMGEEHSRFCTENAKEYAEMVDYYTVWAHQIKTPIASMKLKLQNEDSAFSRDLSAELYRIEQYVEMVLTFLRLNSESTDYIIKEYDLDRIIKTAVKRFSNDFIAKRLTLNYEPVDTKVITDEKWLGFVLEQILSNALKYTKSGSISITLSKDKRLSVVDTGIGISADELPRIFEKGYTGSSGRAYKRASGIGLYLCKRICDNLGHTISASSSLEGGTAITLNLNKKKLNIE